MGYNIGGKCQSCRNISFIVYKLRLLYSMHALRLQDFASSNCSGKAHVLSWNHGALKQLRSDRPKKLPTAVVDLKQFLDFIGQNLRTSFKVLMLWLCGGGGGCAHNLDYDCHQVATLTSNSLISDTYENAVRHIRIDWYSVYHLADDAWIHLL